jgi:hypothetical protein
MTSGRGGMGAAVYRRHRADMLAHNDLCALCGHHGARSADHIVTAKDWPRDPAGRMLPGFNDPANLQPAHGTMGAGPAIIHNPCPTCGSLCNQSRGARPMLSPRSQDW